MNPSKPTGQQPEVEKDKELNLITEALKACEYIRFFNNEGVTIGYCNKKYLQRFIEIRAEVVEKDKRIAELEAALEAIIKSDLCGEIYDGGSVVGTKELNQAKITLNDKA